MTLTDSKSLGKHLLIDFYGCNRNILSNTQKVRDLLLEVARISKVTIVTDVFHTFNPHGVSGVVVIAESHLAVHTWPEHRCASVDVFTCNERISLETIVSHLKHHFSATRVVTAQYARGMMD